MPDGSIGSRSGSASREVLTSYWCKGCESFLFTAPNSWQRMSSSAVLHSSQKFRTGDIRGNMAAAPDELEGKKKLTGCTLKYLFCKSCQGTEKTKLGLLCVRATRDKRYKDNVLISYKGVIIRRGKRYPSEEFIIKDDAQTPLEEPQQTTAKATERAPASRSLSREPQPIQIQSTEDQDGASLDFSASPQREPKHGPSANKDTIMTGCDSVSAQSNNDVPIGSTAAIAHGKTAESAQSSFQLNAGLDSTIQDSDRGRRSARFGSEDSEESIDPADIIKPRDQNNASHDELVRKSETQSFQLEKQGILVDKHTSTILLQQKTIDNLFSRVSNLEKQLLDNQKQFTDRLIELKGQIQANTTACTEPDMTARAAFKRRHQQLESGLQPYVSDSSVAPKMGPLPNDNAADETQATMEYLQRTVRDDDPEDEDFEPLQDKSLSHGQAKPINQAIMNPLLSTAQPLERSPHSKKGSNSVMRSVEGNRDSVTIADDILSYRPPYSSQAFQVPTSTAPASLTSTGPNGHSGTIIRRGVSGRGSSGSSRGRPRGRPPLSHRISTGTTHSTDAYDSPTSTPTTFEPDPKRQRLELGSGSFKTTPKSASGSGSLAGTRDFEGYLLRADGTRDLRSVRGRALGNAAFRPSNGHRVTVESIFASGGERPANIGVPVHKRASTGTATPTPVPRLIAPKLGRPMLSPSGRVTTIADALAAAQGGPSGEVSGSGNTNGQQKDIGREVAQAQREKISAAIGKRPEDGKEYSNRHAEYMSKLGIS